MWKMINELDQYYQLCFNHIVHPVENTNVRFVKPDYTKEDLQACYELCKDVNDNEELWEEFDKRYILSMYDKDDTFLGFSTIGYKPLADAYVMNIYTHPNISFSRMGELITALVHTMLTASYKLGHERSRYLFDIGSKRIYQWLKNLDPTAKMFEIYDRYIVVYVDLPRSQVEAMLSKLEIDNPEQPYLVYEDTLLGYYTIPTNELNKEISIELYPKQESYSERLLEAAIQRLDTLLEGYEHLEVHLTDKKLVDILCSHIDMTVYPISDNYFICHKYLKE